MRLPSLHLLLLASFPVACSGGDGAPDGTADTSDGGGDTGSPTAGNGIELLSDCTDYAGSGAVRCADDGRTIVECQLVDAAYAWAATDACAPGEAWSDEVCWEAEQNGGTWEAECGCPSPDPDASTCYDVSEGPDLGQAVLWACDYDREGDVAPRWYAALRGDDARQDWWSAGEDDDGRGVSDDAEQDMLYASQCVCGDDGGIACSCTDDAYVCQSEDSGNEDARWECVDGEYWSARGNGTCN